MTAKNGAKETNIQKMEKLHEKAQFTIDEMKAVKIPVKMPGADGANDGVTAPMCAVGRGHSRSLESVAAGWPAKTAPQREMMLTPSV